VEYKLLEENYKNLQEQYEGIIYELNE